MAGEQSETGAQGRPGRYQRTPGGLVASMVVIVLVLVGVYFVGGLIYNRDVDTTPESVEYLPTVRDLQDAGADVVYPESLPDGWFATTVEYRPGDEPRFKLDLFTDGSSFVGLRQESEDVDDMVATYVDEDAVEEDPLAATGSGSRIAAEWGAWSDEGGDHAYSAELGETSVLVFGDVSAEDLADLVSRLTTDPAPTDDPAPTEGATPSQAPGS